LLLLLWEEPLLPQVEQLLEVQELQELLLDSELLPEER